MKRVLLTVMLCALMTAPVLAVPSLGDWEEGDPRSTHMVWEFTTGYVVDSGSNAWSAAPEENNSPFSGVGASITASEESWDGQTAFNSNIDIIVNLEIPNYENLSGFKMVWIEVGSNTAPINMGASATDGTFVDFEYVLLPGQGDADFGFKIIPNPAVEKIWFTIPLGQGPTGAPNEIASLDYIHADTICIPAPGAILLGSIGISLVGWMKRRRTL
jgi:hypothetical protein